MLIKKPFKKGMGPGIAPYYKAASGAFTTFDPANVGAALTLSLGNLKATNGTGTDGIAHSINTYSSGLFYCEFTCTNNTNCGIGVWKSGTSVTTFIGSGNNSGGAGFGSGTYSGPFTGTTTCPAIGTGINGHVLGMAVDITNRKMWIKDITAAGNWNANGTADPATGVNGAVMGANISTGALGAAYGAGFNGDNATANFGATAYVGTPPAGFGNW